jgi:hypothetical protein
MIPLPEQLRDGIEQLKAADKTARAALAFAEAAADALQPFDNIEDDPGEQLALAVEALEAGQQHVSAALRAFT